MTFNTKLNIGDTVWHISTREGCIKETTITGITVVHKPTHYLRGECQTKIVYESNDNSNFAEENEGKFWWATRKGIIEYLTNTLKAADKKKPISIAVPRPSKSLDEEFNELFDDNVPHPPTRSSNQSLLKAFEDVFSPKQPLPEEKFKITIPPDLYRRMSKIAEATSKTKHVRCDCGLHRKSELIRRMKKLPGIREKDLNDLYEELFES
jgi:hypothetical protein